MIVVRVCLAALLFGLPVVAEGACIEPISESAYNAFLLRPEAVLQRFPRGGTPLAWTVKYYSTQSPVGLRTIMRLRTQATFEQRRAMGLGLGAAYRYCRTSNPEIAKRIEEAVASVFDPDLQHAFQSNSELDEDPGGSSSGSAADAVGPVGGAAGGSSGQARGLPQGSVFTPKPLPLGDPFAPMR